MNEHTPRNLPWLEQLAIHIPGYGSYLDRGNRRAADRALRDTIAQRLGLARDKIQELIRSYMSRDPSGPSGSLKGMEPLETNLAGMMDPAEAMHRQKLSEVGVLERIERHIDRAAQRLRAAGSGTDNFYSAPDLQASEADTLHAFDLALFERALAILDRFDAPDVNHDFLAELEADIYQFEKKLDERALLLQGIR
ncbi:MAG TPA: hypothetical protein VGY53_10455 [Isosphaeraceae bacterium]|jgi:hypothetical protein|nr:hypothetical protein [Isosphaeraceae bacterium]